MKNLQSMYRNLPPIAVLRTFEAAYRWQGFTAAARELCVTHSAVSQQIRILEERVGHPLFYRSGNAMLPTEHGKRLAQDVKRALEGLASIFDTTSVSDPPERPFLSLEVMTPIAQHWLLPRLHRFRELNPELVLDIRTTPDLVCVESAEPADLALRYGDGHWRGVEKLKIADETVFPVCSPDFLKKHPNITLENFKTLPLLLHSVISWQHWFEQAGLPGDHPTHYLVFSDVSNTIGAALIGEGIAMARGRLVEDYLQDGRLVKVFDIPARGTYSYYLAWQSGSPREELVEKLRSWLVEEFRLSTAAATSFQRAGERALAH
jgi:LysR family glycine cleavage system transcriptional activator